MDYLDNLRNEIDIIDKNLVELFEKRMEIVAKVAKLKDQNNIPVLNSQREDQVLEKNSNHLKNKELEKHLRIFFINLMDLSKDYQKEKMDKSKKER